MAYDLPEGVSLDFKLADEKTAQIEVEIPDKTWFGLVLGSNSMDKGNDMIRFVAKGGS